MTFPEYFPIWDKLDQDQQERLMASLMFRTVPKGTILHNGDMDCTGLLLVKTGPAPGLYPLRRGAGDHPLPPV